MHQDSKQHYTYIPLEPDKIWTFLYEGVNCQLTMMPLQIKHIFKGDTNKSLAFWQFDCAFFVDVDDEVVSAAGAGCSLL